MGDGGQPVGGSGARGVRLLVDARSLYASGLGRYLRSILERLLPDPRFESFRLLGDIAQIREFARGMSATDRIEAIDYPCTSYSLRSQSAWLRLRLRDRVQADVVFLPHYDVPLLGLPRRTVVTVHDLIHFAVPEVFSGWRTRAAGILLHRAVDQAARVLTVSESTRRDLIARQPTAREKVVVIPNGVDSFFQPSGSVGGPAGIEPESFILCVGNRKPHKNHVAAVEVLSRLRRAYPKLRLVVAGPAYAGSEAVVQRAEALGVSEAVHELDLVTDEQLRWLYSNCAALLFPSLYEGFGLPVLEAMACGAPVVSSDRASLPEVVGDAGFLKDPFDFEGMARAIGSLLDDREARRRYRGLGFAQSARFSWDIAAGRVADELVSVALGQGESAPTRIDSGDRPPVVATAE